MSFITQHREEIEKEEIVLFMSDECHLLWGDVCGYVWGKRGERVEIPMTNERMRQTYFGAINCFTKEFYIQNYETANGENTVLFLKYLQAQYKRKRIVLIWDNASYHKGREVKKYLESVNQNKLSHEWEITCLNFAPHAPEQNPVEEIWLKAKNFLREFYFLCKSFTVVKRLFELETHQVFFDLTKFREYGI